MPTIRHAAGSLSRRLRQISTVHGRNGLAVDEALA